MPYKARRLDLEQHGLAKILGSLEAEILEILWRDRSCTARRVCDHLNKKRKLSFNAVNTVLGRLIEKGIVAKEKTDSYYYFTPLYSKTKLTSMVSQDILHNILQDKTFFSIASFTDMVQHMSIAERDELLKTLKKLRNK